MAITNIAISQTNKVGDSNLVAVQSPLSFLADVTYSGAIPEILYCDVYDSDDALLNTFKCIPYKDLTNAIRQFIFIADGILRGYMDEFDDFVQSSNTLEYVGGITEQFTLKFRDPDAGVSDEELEIVAIHASRQFGENPNLSEIFNNDTDNYIAAKGNPCYVYFYNDDISNVLSITKAYLIKFIVSDSVGFVENALVQINGSSDYTNVDGEVSFELKNGNYSYTITKEGYQDYNNTVVVNGGDLTIPITILELGLSDIDFETNLGGNSQVLIAAQGDDPFVDYIFREYVPSSTGEVTISDVPTPATYTIGFYPYPGICSGKLQDIADIYIDGLSPIVYNVPLNTSAQVNFHIEDTLGNPLQGVEIGQTETSAFICKVSKLTTDINGDAQTTLPRYDFELGEPNEELYRYVCTKAGYITFGSTFQINSDTGFTINVIMQSI